VLFLEICFLLERLCLLEARDLPLVDFFGRWRALVVLALASDLVVFLLAII
jgi:hypothetical protein